MASPANDIVIAATSDIHGFLDNLEDDIDKAKPNVLVIAGDIHPCRIDINAKQWFEYRFFPMVERIGEKYNTQVVAIPGNHDFQLSYHICGREKCMELPSNFHLLCDEGINVCGLKFYGTPWSPIINGQWCFEASEHSLEYEFSLIPDNVDVLITHTPPLLNHKFIDISTQHLKSRWRHFGSKELTNAIKEKKPRYCFCGHIHSGDHSKHEIDCNGSICEAYNVSRVDEQYIVKYPMTIITISKR